MTTAAERLAALSGLSGVSAGAHLLAIRISGSMAGQILVSRSTLSTGSASDHLLDSGVAQGGYSAEVELKRWYVKRGKRIHVFSTGQDADAFLDAEQAAQAVVEKAQKTSRRARKRLRERILVVDAPPLQTVEIDALVGLVDRYSIPVNLPALLAHQDYARVLEIMALAMQMQDDEDVEMLLLM